MGVKTRYLQLSDVIMLEYTFRSGNDDSTSSSGSNEFVYTKLADGHYTVFSPNECEVEIVSEGSGAKRKPLDEVDTFNDLNHLSVPKDGYESYSYTFLDPDYAYCDSSNLTELHMDNDKVRQYAKQCTNPFDTEKENPFEYLRTNYPVGWDTMKLYFVNGYDFGNTYGINSRITLSRTDGGKIDICNMFINKTVARTMMHMMSRPIIFGNCIYDRYIEINLPCLDDILHPSDEAIDSSTLNDYLCVAEHTNVRLNFAYVDQNDRTIYELTDDIYNVIASGNASRMVNCDFLKSSQLNGAIPPENISSDSLGVYIAENPDSPYLEFCGTWKGDPLSFSIVQTFNRSVKLYDTSVIRKANGTYEVSSDYSPEINLKKWIAIHELECKFFKGNELIKSEVYTMTQTFAEEANESRVFYYRPVIFDEAMCELVDMISVNYNMRFMNVEDKVQFLKKGSLSITNISKFYAKGTNIGAESITPYKIYNRITESKQTVSGGVSINPKPKYVKVFYNSSDIILDGNNNLYNDDGNFVLELSQVAKTYKFTFKKRITASSYDYMDLSGGYYKLYMKDADSNPIILDPTYSSNMNTVLGELEFNIPTSVINKLSLVSEDNRKMSVVAYNDDNSVSSMFDFVYKL